MDRDFIGRRITELLIMKNMSEYQLSFDIGKSKSYIQSITSNRSEPSMQAVRDIFDSFDRSLSEFFDENLSKPTYIHLIAQKLSELREDQLEAIEMTIDCFTEDK